MSDGGQEKLVSLCRGNVFGTYVHGIFDSTAGRLYDALLKRAGVEQQSPEFKDQEDFLEEELDRLAGAVRRSLDMEAVYRIAGVDKRP